MKNNNYVGWEEWVSLPELNLPALLAKTDTGAETSALHAFNIQTFGKNNEMVRFGINPIDNDERFSIFCSSKILDQRNVTSSNGISEMRYVIETEITIGNVRKKIPITLTNRENMKYKMIIGRSALEGFQISADKSFLQNALNYDLYKKAKVKKAAKTFGRRAANALMPKAFIEIACIQMNKGGFSQNGTKFIITCV